MIVHLKDYQQFFDGDDATLALREALLKCKDNPGSTLCLGGGELHFRKTYAFEAEFYMSNNDGGHKHITFPIIDFKDLTIDGEGASLIFYGTILPFVIYNSHNITLKNFTVDYPKPFFFQTFIQDADEHRLVLDYDPSIHDIVPQDQALLFRRTEDAWEQASSRILTTEFDVQTNAPCSHTPPFFFYFKNESDGSFLQHMYRFVKPSLEKPGKLIITGDLQRKLTPGNSIVATFGGRHCPGIFGYLSSDITVQDVTFYHVPAMGIICQLCNNVTMRRFKTIPTPNSGRLLSVNADSTHFVNCTGLIHYDSCTFLNMLDDAGNIHGTYMKCVKTLDAHSLLLKFCHGQQVGINLYKPGDQVNIVHNLTMQPVATMTVQSATLVSNTFTRIQFLEKLPPMQTGFVIENFTQMPELIIENCESGNNRPRGFLISTRKKALVTTSTFYNMNTALHLTGDSNDWFESGPVNDLTVTKNRFVNAAYAGGSAITVTPHVLEGEAPYHSNIRITDNLFELQDKRFLVARYAENILMKNNTFVQNPNLPNHGRTGTDGFDLKYCQNCHIEPPTEN